MGFLGLCLNLQCNAATKASSRNHKEREKPYLPVLSPRGKRSNTGCRYNADAHRMQYRNKAFRFPLPLERAWSEAFITAQYEPQKP